MLVRIVAILILATPAGGQSADRPGGAAKFEDLSHQAVEARDAKRLDEALNLYKKALNLKPDWEDGWWNAGSIAYDMDNYTECVSDFRRLAALKPDLAPAWTLEGLCEYRLRDYDAALKSLTQVQRMRFQEDQELSRKAMLHLALVLAKLGYFEKAIVLLFDLSSIDQRTPEIIVAAGIAGLRKPWIPPEVPESDQDKVFKLGDAMAAVMQRDAKGAIEKFEAAVRDYPKEPEIHYRFGAFLLEQDPDRGIQEIKQTLDLEPGHAPALVALARIYLKRDEPKTALPYAQEAVKLSPGDFNTHLALGRALLATEDTSGAVRELELGVRLDPESPVAHFSLASAYAKIGRKTDAAREREQFKRLRESIDSNLP
jgi:tetratricopeptide (TPR) repeat protein